MPGNSFGNLYQITSFGESHGAGIGVVIDGCPAGIEISREEIQLELDRRRPGQSIVTTDRDEADQVEILSGISEGVTLGSPIAMLIRNKDQRSQDYGNLAEVYRPSHADFTYEQKYGRRAVAGGGRSSARETVARIMAGVIARKILKEKGIEIVASVKQIHKIKAELDVNSFTRDEVEANIVRCADPTAAEKMIELVKQMKQDGNSVGGVITAVARNVPTGLGEPVYDRLEAELAKAMLSINATKGFEIGSGFSGTRMTGLEHNDEFVSKDGKIGTKTNRSGGVQGGISNGEPIVCNIAFKPTSTVLKTQKTVDSNGNEVTLENLKGRHDPAVLPRAVPIVEAMMAIVLLDALLQQNARKL
ncbi:chorismate synthase [Candidatus Saccharibacteria bacterium]|nr:chorismate synthase [Candidatus Saccharibacteria bacterium]